MMAGTDRHCLIDVRDPPLAVSTLSLHFGVAAFQVVPTSPSPTANFAFADWRISVSTSATVSSLNAREFLRRTELASFRTRTSQQQTQQRRVGWGWHTWPWQYIGCCSSCPVESMPRRNPTTPVRPKGGACMKQPAGTSWYTWGTQRVGEDVGCVSINSCSR